MKEKKMSVNHKIEKVDSKKHSEGRVRKSFFVKESEVRREFKKNEFMLMLVYKESYINLSNTNDSLPSVVMSLLQEFDDVFDTLTKWYLSPKYKSVE